MPFDSRARHRLTDFIRRISSEYMQELHVMSRGKNPLHQNAVVANFIIFIYRGEENGLKGSMGWKIKPHPNLTPVGLHLSSNRFFATEAESI